MVGKSQEILFFKNKNPKQYKGFVFFRDIFSGGPQFSAFLAKCFKTWKIPEVGFMRVGERGGGTMCFRIFLRGVLSLEGVYRGATDENLTIPFWH